MTDAQATLIAGIAGAIIGAAIGIFAEPIRRAFFKPKLSLQFDGGSPDCVTLTPMDDGSNAYYLRIKAANDTNHIATGCRAFLVEIEKEEDGRFRPTDFNEGLQLAWSCRPGRQFEGIDIYEDVPQFIDVIKTTSRRGIDRALPEIIFRDAADRYLDAETGHRIAVGEAALYGREREVMVAYREEAGRVTLLTIHPLKEGQRENRLASGRWRAL